MQLVAGEFVFSPTDLVNHLACEHLSQLNRLAATGELVRPTDDRSEADLLRRLGNDHELGYLAKLRAKGLSIVEIADPDGTEQLAQRHDETIAAMQHGVDVIFQATFFDGTWRGHADFLFRTDHRNPITGVWHYEPYDTKLARTAKVSALVQLADYAHHLDQVQGAMPERVHIVLGDDSVSSFDTHLLSGYHRRARERLQHEVANAPGTYPHPVNHCAVCRWYEHCDTQRREDDHLSLVNGVGLVQIKSLRSVGITSGADLAVAPAAAKPASMQQSTWDRICRQAQLQRQASHATEFELVDVGLHPTGGLTLLPEPSAGDLFFDIEGDPHRGHKSAGLEYLWGVSDANDEFTKWWAHDVDDERWAFEACVDHFIAALERDPGMHIYHYAPYEITVLKRLASRFASRVEEVDHLLRNDVLVDLYAVARHAVRISSERFSIKDLEAFYRDKRATEVQSGLESVVQYEQWLDSGSSADQRTQSILDDICDYNRDDCVSTRQLRDWLEERRVQAIAGGADLHRPQLGVDELSSELTQARRESAALRESLVADHDASQPGSHARWLLGNLVEYHDRESKPAWWKHFEQAAMSPAQLWDDSEAVANLVDQGFVEKVKRSNVYELSFDPQQPHKLKPDTRSMADYAKDAKGSHRGITIHSVDLVAGRVQIKQAASSDLPMPQHLISSAPINTTSLHEAVIEVAEHWQQDGSSDRLPAIRDLLLRRVPRLAANAPLMHDGESATDAVVRLAGQLDNSCLAVQGPPGTGKTFTGARMIRQLVADGKRVGVVSNSHRAVENLLEEIVQDHAAGERVLKVGAEMDHLADGIEYAQTKPGAQAVLNDEFDVVGGTAWFFARPDLRQAFDVLVVDEAGQFSLANTIAAATSAKNLVLLGDPQQLEQPVQGTHPDGVAVSALTHFIGDHASTIDVDRGIFLDDTWRMHADICSFVSDNFYEGRLSPSASKVERSIDGVPAGTYWQPVDHYLNKARSSEEAERAVDIAAELTGRIFTSVGADGGVASTRPLTIDDIMFITPFNAQVGAIRTALAQAGFASGKVGTVDLFQGRQAPVVIYSLASSNGDLAPRGIDFLFSANRFNVAISRAQVAAIVLGNPALLNTNARRPEQLPLVGALCNYVDQSQDVVWAPDAPK